ncbi:MAG: hypothetical protein XD83_0733 [Synergistales bacterium 57_84]|nr:MAG: hypothetical protein XD83_0733 [Synergistales bacterium 57_84]KUK89939.1 MAG: hypothetical protein XE04_1646 [Marinimicrobia bacterium 46_43]
MIPEASEQILKCHDDYTPVRFCVDSGTAVGAQLFKLKEGSACSWVKQGESFGPDKLRSRIEPWLTALFQSEHLSVLVGSGLTHALHGMATNNGLPGMRLATFGAYKDEIAAEAKRSAEAAGRGDGNIEDQIRVTNELLRGLEIIASKETGSEQDVSRLRSDLTRVLSDFASSILKGEEGVISADRVKRELTFNYLVSFLMSFASRSGTRDRLHLFTTNYDRCIEAGADVAGLRLIDRFVGTLAPIFRSSRLDVDMHYNPPGIRGEPRYLEGVARFTKLHGSVDWVDCNKIIQRVALPFGAQDIDPYLNTPGLKDAGAMQIMIYPNASKDRETASYPYVELFRDFAAATCRPNSTLICYGYSFSDEHINRVIEDMLTIPSAHLVVIAYGDPLDRIMRTYERLGRPAQITLLIGSHLGDFRTLVDHYLPKPAIDQTTFRMADLLKARWGAVQGEGDVSGTESKSEGDPAL